MLILGLSCFYHDSAAALIQDGHIIAAAQEERFSRKRHDPRFPENAIRFCLEQADVHLTDVDHIVFYDLTSLSLDRILTTAFDVSPEGAGVWKSSIPGFVRNKLGLPDKLKKMGWNGPVHACEHHATHAAAAFYPSPFQEAAILTVDGVGEWATASIGVGRGNTIEILEEMHYPHSLGLLYSAFTYFTGFRVNSGEYKLMGLAPYGKPKYRDIIVDKVIRLGDDGSVELNMDYFAFRESGVMTTPALNALLDGPPREPESRITQREMDLAASIQKVTEEAVLLMARHARDITGATKLCLSGGVALNCVANGHILRSGLFEDLWIQPAAGDAGSALGAALAWYYLQGKHERNPEAGLFPDQKGSYWGPAFSNSEIDAYLESNGIPFDVLESNSRAATIASALADGNVVGHFAGRMEFGPRALGARSILGDPRSGDMQRTINLKIKYRESFRPFAPSVLEECASDYFELEGTSPYMLLVAPVKDDIRLNVASHDDRTSTDLLTWVNEKRSTVPAITHVDYSARIQTVREEHHPKYYQLIKAFHELTGCPIVVNTSFNVRGEPIVCSPADAYACFMRTEMDVLVLEDRILYKDKQPEWLENKDWKNEFALD
jgi:carbamoyltransferase